MCGFFIVWFCVCVGVLMCVIMNVLGFCNMWVCVYVCLVMFGFVYVWVF